MLNAAQIARRIGKLGGSDMNIVMGGDAQKINNLWLEKMGDKIPDDLSEIWEVYRGSETEEMHLNWIERYGFDGVVGISRRGNSIDHYRYDWAMCTLDGWVNELSCPVEVKWTNGHEPFDPVILNRYFPQCQWQMEMTGADQCAISVVMGAVRPVVDFIKRDVDYAKQMLARGWTFIQHVRNKTPPVDMPMVPLPVDATRVVDMTGNNEWANQSGIWSDLRDSAAAYDDAAKILKSLVPPDAKRCFGHGVQITRNRLGHLSLREMKE
jgi:predicted phage-related endonuclease